MLFYPRNRRTKNVGLSNCFANHKIDAVSTYHKLIKIIICRRHRIRHVWLTPVCFYQCLCLRFLQFPAHGKNDQTRVVNLKWWNSVPVLSSIGRSFFFFFEMWLLLKKTAEFQPLYMDCCVHISLQFKNQAYNTVRETYYIIVNPFCRFSFLVCVCFIYVLFVFFQACFAHILCIFILNTVIYSPRTIYQTNNREKEKKTNLTYRKIHFDLNCMFFSFHCLFMPLFYSSMFLRFLLFHNEYVPYEKIKNQIKLEWVTTTTTTKTTLQAM